MASISHVLRCLPVMAVCGCAQEPRQPNYEEPQAIAPEQQSAAQKQGVAKPDTIENLRDIDRDEELYLLSEAVGMLSVEFANGTKEQCTATLVSRNELITAEHCLPSRERQSSREKKVVGAVLKMGFYHGEVTDTYAVRRIPKFADVELDVSIAHVAEEVPGKYGYGRLVPRSIRAEEQLYIVHHPDGLPKQVTRSRCRASSRRSYKRFEFLHTCDTIGGSSGGPIFDADSDEIVALHTGGYSIREPGQFNEATLISAIAEAFGPSFARYSEGTTILSLAAQRASMLGQSLTASYRPRRKEDGTVVFRNPSQETGAPGDEVLLNGRLASSSLRRPPAVFIVDPSSTRAVTIISSKASSDYDQNGNLLSQREKECLDYLEASVLNASVGYVTPHVDCDDISDESAGPFRFRDLPAGALNDVRYYSNPKVPPRVIVNLQDSGNRDALIDDANTILAAISSEVDRSVSEFESVQPAWNATLQRQTETVATRLGFLKNELESTQAKFKERRIAGTPLGPRLRPGNHGIDTEASISTEAITTRSTEIRRKLESQSIVIETSQPDLPDVNAHGNTVIRSGVTSDSSGLPSTVTAYSLPTGIGSFGSSNVYNNEYGSGQTSFDYGSSFESSVINGGTISGSSWKSPALEHSFGTRIMDSYGVPDFGNPIRPSTSLESPTPRGFPSPSQ